MNRNRDYSGDFSQQGESDTYERLANGLGWFSLGLGLAEVAAPGSVARLIGIQDDDRNRTLLRSPLYGMRELAAGAGILSQSRPTAWVWSRVAGDIMDLGSLACAMASDRNDRKKVAMGMVAVAGVTALDVICAQGLSRAAAAAGEAPSTSRSLTINKSPEEVYTFWRNFENLPRFMRHLEWVQVSGDNRSRWCVRGPAGKMVEWEAETVQDEPNRLIAWRSVEGSEVDNSGRVTFQNGPGGRGTIVKVEIEYNPPGGIVGAAVAKLFGKSAGQMLDDDLRALKQILEVGEVVNSDASIHRGMHAAQPPERNESTLRHELGSGPESFAGQGQSQRQSWGPEGSGADRQETEYV